MLVFFGVALFSSMRRLLTTVIVALGHHPAAAPPPVWPTAGQVREGLRYVWATPNCGAGSFSMGVVACL